MATIKWDHIVHYVNDLDATIETFKENGLIAFRGGSHKEWGTFNSLSYFGLSYIEFLGVENHELAIEAAPTNLIVEDSVKLLPEKESLSRIAIRTDDIEEVAATLKERGLELSPILDGKRLNTHGQLIQWRMMTIKGHFQGLNYPFVIQWIGTDEERLESLTASKIIHPHPAGEIVLKNGIFRVDDPHATANHWRKLFSLSEVSSDSDSVTLGFGEHQLIFERGDANQLVKIEFQTDSDELKGKTIVIGEGEYSFK